MRSVAPLAVVALLAGSLAVAQPASQPGSEDVQRAQQLVDSGEFEQAVTVLESALDRGELTDAMLGEVYRLLGLARLYLGDEAGARVAYEKLLQAQPDFELPRSAPPKLQQLYARIRDDIRKRRVRPVTLTAAPIPEASGGAAVTVPARIEELPLGARAKLFYRRGGAQAYSSVGFTRVPGDREAFTATIPAYAVPAEARGYDLEYYLEVADGAQRRLAGKADAYNPLTFQVRAAPAAPMATQPAWYQNPWVWVAGGAVAAGAVTGIVLVATARQTGPVTITITVGAGARW